MIRHNLRSSIYSGGNMKNLTRFALLLLAALLLTIAAVPALAAERPAITVTPSWRPGSQLTSLDTFGPVYPAWEYGDDYRYVDLDIYATSNVNYWAVQVSCTLDATALDSYVWDEPMWTGDAGDDVQPVQWGPAWGTLNADYTAVVEPLNALGKVTITAAKYGYSWPMGQNGSNTTQLLATLRFRVKPQVTNPYSKSISPRCTADFLDKDGKSVLRPTYARSAALNIMSGYTLSGSVIYQAAPRSSAGIGIDCYLWGLEPPYSTVTDTRGNFAFTNLREFGTYICYYYGNVIDSYNRPDLHLMAQNSVQLDTTSKNLLPIYLTSGNVARSYVTMTGQLPASMTGTEIINDADIALITGAWNAAVPVAFEAGDASGDRKVDKADLAIVAGNYGEAEWQNAEHLLFGLAPYNSRTYYGHIWDKDLTEVGKSRSNEYWPTLSPDGTQIAFVREERGGEFALYVEDLNGRAKRLSPSRNWTYDAFAPSWSPDGTQIAFNCSWRDDAYGYRAWQYYQNGSDICVIGADGTNLRTIAWNAHVFPPAWWDDQTLFFGGTTEHYDWNGSGGETIYAVRITDGFELKLSPANLPLGASMPAVAESPLGRALTYSYDDTGTGIGTLRWAQIDPYNILNDGFEAVPAWQDMNSSPTAPYHVNMTWDNGGSYQDLQTWVDFYTVAHTRCSDVIYSVRAPYGPWEGRGGDRFWISYLDWDATVPAGPPVWEYPNAFSVTKQSDNPYWNGDINYLSDRFGLRNTVDWVN
jgi:hypothetical protein